MVRVDGSARLAPRGQNSPQLRRAQGIQPIHISTSSRDDAVHAQHTRGDDADGETQRISGARRPPGRRPWQQRGRRPRAGPGATDHPQSTAAVHCLRAGPRRWARANPGESAAARHSSAGKAPQRCGRMPSHNMRSAPTLRDRVPGQVPRLVVGKTTAPPGFREARAGPLPLFNAPERPPERERRYALTPS